MNNNDQKKEIPTFPIIYNEHCIDNELYTQALYRLKSKFDISDKETIRLLSDIIKCVITNNRHSSNLIELIDTLGDPTWTFLRDENIDDVIKKLYKREGGR